MFRIYCSLAPCDYSSTRSSNVVRHLRQSHEASDDAIAQFQKNLAVSRAGQKGNGDAWQCEGCGHVCPSKKGLASHMQRKHGSKKVEDPAIISLLSSPEKKPPPPKMTRTRGEPVLLERSEDGPSRKSSTRKGSGALACPACTVCHDSREALASHFAASHCEQSEVEQIFFERQEEFDEWLEIRRKETCSDFRIRTSHKDGLLRYLVCSREGVPDVVGNIERVRKLSKKTTGTDLCPAFMAVDRSAGGIRVRAYFEHYGHCLDHAFRKLSLRETGVIVDLMQLGMTNQIIISKLEADHNLDTRLHYTNNDDLRYIRRIHGLFEGRFDLIDLLSVKKRVERGFAEDGIRVYEEPVDDTGKGFVLILMTPDQVKKAALYSFRGVCIDDTHNTTKYSLKLTTLLTLNGRDRGVPVAFMLSASVSSEEVRKLFQVVKALVPAFNPKFFMSDEARAFWNGFRMVFPDTHTKRTVCRWHVLRAWGQQAEKLLSHEEATKVQASLRAIIREADENILTKRVLTLLSYLESSSQGSKFAEYLRKNYLSSEPNCCFYPYWLLSDCREEWAVAYRKGAPFQTSMFSESWHACLKGMMSKRTNNRIDELIQIILNAYTSVVTRIAKQSARNLAKCSGRRAQTLRNCIRAQKEERDYVVREAMEGIEVTKRTGTQPYLVKDNMSCDCFSDENTHCQCGACAYRYDCTCPDQKSGIACKHIHMAIAYSKSTELEMVQLDGDGEVLEYDMLPFRSFPSPPRPTTSRNSLCLPIGPTHTDEKQKVFDECNRLIDKLSTTIRRLNRSRSNDDLHQLQHILTNMKNADAFVPAISPAPDVPVRRSASSTPQTARNVMNHLKKRTKSRKQPESYAKGIGYENDPDCCGVCNRPDPPLPWSMDPEEVEARVIEWVRCPQCSIPTHSLCAPTFCSCSRKFQFYTASDDDSNDDSD